MRLVIKDTSVIPSDGWQYPHPVAGARNISTRNYALFYKVIVETYTANGVAPPSEQEVIDYTCKENFVSCFDSETKEPLINKLTLGLAQPTTSCCGS